MLTLVTLKRVPSQIPHRIRLEPVPALAPGHELVSDLLDAPGVGLFTVGLAHFFKFIATNIPIINQQNEKQPTMIISGIIFLLPPQ